MSDLDVQNINSKTGNSAISIADSGAVTINSRVVSTDGSTLDSLETSVTSLEAWTPEKVLRMTTDGAWYDIQDLSSMNVVYDGSGNVPAVGDPVGLILDKSGHNRNLLTTTSSKRPTLRQTIDGIYYLEFDGVDDQLSTVNAITLDEHFIIAAGLQAQGLNGSSGNQTAFGLNTATTEQAALAFRVSNGSIGRLSLIIRDGAGTQSVAASGNASYSDLELHLASGGFYSGNMFISTDGTVESTVARTAATQISYQMYVGMGSNETMNFYGGAFLVLKTVSPTTFNSLEQYVADQVGVTLS